MRKHIRLAAWLELSSYLVRISSFQSLCVRLSSVSWHSLCLAEPVSPSVKGDPSSRYFLRFSPVGHPSLPVLCPVSHTSSLSAYVLQKALQSSLKTDTVSYQLPCHLPTERMLWAVELRMDLDLSGVVIVMSSLSQVASRAIMGSGFVLM